MTASNPSISPSEIFLARWVYEQIACIRDQSFGPALRMPPYCFEIYDYLLPALEKFVGPPRQEVLGVYEVPSPWHAVLILESLQHNLCMRNQRAVFRGQENSEWKICSSISRKNVNIQLEKFKAKLFCDILSEMSFNLTTVISPDSGRFDLCVPQSGYLAAAQHYGIKTELVDFTSDPAVAVFFASCGTPPTQKSSVFVFSLENAVESGCDIIIPPPFVERLHTQRGFFLRHSDASTPWEGSKHVLCEIRFPCSYDFRPFSVVRDGRRIDLLKSSLPIEAITSIVNETVASSPIESIPQSQYEQIVFRASQALKSKFADFYQDPELWWYKYLTSFEDMLYWTAYFPGEHFPAKNSLAINREILNNIVRSNPELVRSISQLYRRGLKIGGSLFHAEMKPFIEEVVSLLENLMTENSVPHNPSLI